MCKENANFSAIFCFAFFQSLRWIAERTFLTSFRSLWWTHLEKRELIALLAVYLCVHILWRNIFTLSLLSGVGLRSLLWLSWATFVCRAKTQISLGICPVWTESSLSTQWVAKTQAFFMRTTKTLVRLGGCPNWSESSPDAPAIFLVLSCRGSFVISFQDKSIVKPCRLPYPM